MFLVRLSGQHLLIDNSQIHKASLPSIQTGSTAYSNLHFFSRGISCVDWGTLRNRHSSSFLSRSELPFLKVPIDARTSEQYLITNNLFNPQDTRSNAFSCKESGLTLCIQELKVCYICTSNGLGSSLQQGVYILLWINRV